MTYIQWSERFDSGVEILDQHRQKFLELINRFHGAVVRQNRPMIDSLLDELYSHTISCFEFEEQLMGDSGYEFTELHKRIHDRFIERYAKYWQRYEAGEDNTKRFSSFLQKWVVHHLGYEDKDYLPKINQLLEEDRTQGKDQQHWWTGILHR